ncbi:MAG: hypothetical protein ACAH12_00545 [Methylophilaceae bacterium]|uniref:hypothetical protein n=1 Tax=Methylovorus sp. MM2 TaxID=1848038 RepID=UPI0007E257EA|nr:hypothetical protein [Methylovorus sp. MM2]OAM53210.1 hypothetical protein A7981_07385 [Methylovorus sp. MM2]
MKKIAFMLIALALAACSTTKPKSDGREWIEVSCSGFADWSACNDKAARLCPDGYNVAKRDENWVTQGRVMTFACKK